jgi:hypothetical protein
MTDISKDTLRKIKEQQIVPRTKNYFFLKRSTVWVIFGLSIILGSFAASVAVFQVKNAEWDLFKHYRHSVLEFILLFIPYFWILFMIGFSIVAFYYFRRTESGYRYRTATIVALSVFISILGGLGIYATGLSERIETVFEDNIPFYRGAAFHSRMAWMSPDKGLLAGKIIEITKEGKLKLADLNGKEWEITVDGALWKGKLSPEPDLEIKIIGNKTDKNCFTAQEIRPWQGRKKNRGSGKGRHRGKMYHSTNTN